MSVKGRRKLKEPDFREGRRTTVALDTLNVVDSYELRADYGIEVAGGTGAGDPYADAPGRVVEQLRVLMQVNGVTVPFVNMLGRDNLLIQHILRPAPLSQKAPADDVTESGLHSTYWIPFAVPRALGDSGEQTALPTPRVSAPTLEVLTGRAEDVFEAEDGTITYEAGSYYTLTERPIIGASPGDRRFGHFFNYIEHPIEADRHDVALELPQMQPGDELVRVFVICEENDVRTDGVMPSLGLEINGVEVFGKLAREVYQSQNMADYNLAQLHDGVIVFDFAEDGSIAPADLMRITRAEGHAVRADVRKLTGSCKVRILSEWIRGRAS